MHMGKVVLQMLIGTGTVGEVGLKLAHCAGVGAPDGLTEALPL
jgi:hypothetical protein